MCMSQQEVRNTIHRITVSRISAGDGSYSPYEWNMLEEAYISHVPSTVCAGMMDVEQSEVDQIYQLFSIQAALSGLQQYLNQPAVTQ